MDRYDWRRLNHLQVGRYAEYLVKMEFTLYGFDVYSAEVDDHGIDFVIRRDTDRYYDIQVKSARLSSTSYVFFPKRIFTPRANLLAAVVLFRDHQPPDLYLLPSTAWLSPNALLVSRDYSGGAQSPPEWGLKVKS